MNTGRGIALTASMFDTQARERFWARVDRSGDCWPWQAGTISTGYGMLRLPGAGDHRVLAHRVSFALTHGSVDATTHVCHKCDNPLCVRPEHLFPGTPQINALDMVAKGRCGSTTPPEIQAAIILMARRGMNAARISKWLTMSYVTVAKIAREAIEVDAVAE